MPRYMDTIGGVSSYFEHDSKAGKSIINHVQDVEPFIEFNKHAAEKLDKRQDWWFVGTIPDTVVLQWANECNAKPYSRKWRRYATKQLNKAEYRKLNPNKVRLDSKDDR